LHSQWNMPSNCIQFQRSLDFLCHLLLTIVLYCFIKKIPKDTEVIFKVFKIFNISLVFNWRLVYISDLSVAIAYKAHL
jgi:hypothetical protein